MAACIRVCGWKTRSGQRRAEAPAFILLSGGRYHKLQCPDDSQGDVGIRFKGVEKTNVEEYCISESWVRVPAAKTRDRFGNPLLMKLTGEVEAWFKTKPAEG